MSIIHVTKENFEEEVLNSTKPVILDFWATWCGPCRMIAPILEDIAQEREDIKICKVNVDEQGELAMQYKIASIPTLIVMKNGEAVNKTVGVLPKAEILKMV